ncbi:antibiotic biosynthesis monooxygenase family protein [Streptomyces sp. enrichment culture]|uniref:antibiotic biosynthesis monooxygenase family protein n=1 Tax=Streptomyces sp. enrichment culture TaxID=1795815 RepID=UPI003F55AF44
MTTARAAADTGGGRTGSGVFRVLLRMEIHPGREREFEETWLSVGEAVTSRPGNVAQWLLREAAEEDGAEGSVYYIVSDWTDEPSFRAFESSAAHVRHRELLHPYRGAGSMTTMRMVYELRGAGAG